MKHIRIKSTGKLRTCTQAYVFLSANNWIIHCLSTWIILLFYMCRRGMDDYHTQKCSFPDCCKDIRISEPEIFNVTRIELNTCSNQLNEQIYRITSTKGTTWTLKSKKCCQGVIHVYFGKYHLHSCGNVIHIFSLYLICSLMIRVRIGFQYPLLVTRSN